MAAATADDQRKQTTAAAVPAAPMIQAPSTPNHPPPPTLCRCRQHFCPPGVAPKTRTTGTRSTAVPSRLEQQASRPGTGGAMQWSRETTRTAKNVLVLALPVAGLASGVLIGRSPLRSIVCGCVVGLCVLEGLVVLLPSSDWCVYMPDEASKAAKQRAGVRHPSNAARAKQGLQHGPALIG